MTRVGGGGYSRTRRPAMWYSFRANEPRTSGRTFWGPALLLHLYNINSMCPGTRTRQSPSLVHVFTRYTHSHTCSLSPHGQLVGRSVRRSVGRSFLARARSFVRSVGAFRRAKAYSAKHVFRISATRCAGAVRLPSLANETERPPARPSLGASLTRQSETQFSGSRACVRVS